MTTKEQHKYVVSYIDRLYQITLYPPGSDMGFVHKKFVNYQDAMVEATMLVLQFGGILEDRT